LSLISGQRYIHWKIPFPPGGISADIIWGKIWEKGKRKRGKKRKRNKGEKEEREKKKEERGSKRVK
jgi:hypothetical protein